MKRITLFVLLTVFASSITNAQVIAEKCIVTLKESSNGDLVASSGGIEVSFEPKSVTMNTTIKNISDNDLEIVWDKSSFIINGKASKVMTDGVAKINKSDPLQNSIIPKSAYIEKMIMPLDNWHSNIAPSDLLNWKWVRSYNKQHDIKYEIKLLLAVLSEGSINNHEFTFILDSVKK